MTLSLLHRQGRVTESRDHNLIVSGKRPQSNLRFPDVVPHVTMQPYSPGTAIPTTATSVEIKH